MRRNQSSRTRSTHALSARECRLQARLCPHRILRSQARWRPLQQLARRGERPRASNPTAQRSRSLFASQRTIRASHIRRQRNSLGVPPQSFEVIESARLVLEDMDDEVAVINQYPLRSIVALDAQSLCALLFQLLDDLVRNGLHLPHVCAARDNKVVRKACHFAQVQHDDVQSLLIARRAQGRTDSLIQLFGAVVWIL